MNHQKLQKLRHRAFVEQGCKCIYCELPIWESDSSEFATRFRIKQRTAKHLQCTAEHLLAAQDGGNENRNNIAAACLWCNRMRHLGRHDRAPDPERYKKRILQLMRKNCWHPASVSQASQN